MSSKEDWRPAFRSMDTDASLQRQGILAALHQHCNPVRQSQSKKRRQLPAAAALPKTSLLAAFFGLDRLMTRSRAFRKMQQSLVAALGCAQIRP
jgi:hypothetical protein